MKSFNREPSKRGHKKTADAQIGLNSVKCSVNHVLQSRTPLKYAFGALGVLALAVASIAIGNQQTDGKSTLDEASKQTTQLSPPTDSAIITKAAFTPELSNSSNAETITSSLEHSTHSEDQISEKVEKERIFHRIKRGESLGSIMQSYSFPSNYPYQIVNAENGKLFTQIRAGKQLEFVLNKDTNALEEIHYPYSKLTRLVANISDDISVGFEEIPHEIVQNTAIGQITHSLFGAASEAGISDNMIMELAEIFGWDIDFVRDIRQGDSFKLIYEQHVSGETVLQEGSIIAAEFTSKGQTFTAIKHTDKDNNVGYYAPDGSSMKGTFLKSPMKFSRISSGFSKKRFHPVLKKWRAHKGVDYAARTGTPIRSVANGKVIHRGTKGGYGKTIVLSHGGKYSTLYAHMSKYHPKVKSGKYVKQGQIIGYVGSTGLSTGPHLHYEFRVNGVHRNPLTYKTPKASAISASERPNFEANVERQQIALNNIRSKEQDSNLVAAAINIIKDNRLAKAVAE